LEQAAEYCAGVERGICTQPGCTKLAEGEFLMGLSFCKPHLRAIRRLATRMARRKNQTEAQRQELGEAYGWACVYCCRRGTPERDPDGRFWHADHEDAWCETWDNSPQALVLACTKCNTAKQDRRWRPGHELPSVQPQSPIDLTGAEQVALW